MVPCPSCQSSFAVETINGVSVALCDSCDGLWLAPGDLDRLTGQDLEQQLDGWLSEPTECRYCQAPLGFDDSCVRCGKAPTIQCPRGHGVMQTTLIELGAREFEIDRCSSCGSHWVDAHEREHLHTSRSQIRPVEIIHRPAGGIERAASALGEASVGNSFVAIVLQELARPSRVEGYPRPVGLGCFVFVIGGAVLAIYYLVGPLNI